jgi:predicted O-methyltransferase YrrM
MNKNQPRGLKKVTGLLAKLLRPFAYASLPIMASVVSRLVRGNDAYPIFSTDSYWDSSSDLVGIDIDEKRSIEFIEKNIDPYKAEFARYPIQDEGSEAGFYLLNGRFMAVDGDVYYALIRSIKPKRILEVGCGMSTLLASDAVQKNSEEGFASELVCVEPYRTALLESANLRISELVAKKIQQVSLDVFASLGKGDILFIDTSHVLKSGGDVQFLYCEVLPRLKSGVYVHVHDISLPRPYPRVYFEKSYFFWNEQYLLQAFLTHNAHAEVIWPGNYMMVKRSQWMMKTFPELQTMREQYPSSEPSSFWFRTR